MQSMGRRILALMAFLVGALGFVELSHGHALQPGYLELRLIDKELYATIRRPIDCISGSPPVAPRDGVSRRRNAPAGGHNPARESPVPSPPSSS